MQIASAPTHSDFAVPFYAPNADGVTSRSPSAEAFAFLFYLWYFKFQLSHHDSNHWLLSKAKRNTMKHKSHSFPRPRLLWRWCVCNEISLRFRSARENCLIIYTKISHKANSRAGYPQQNTRFCSLQSFNNLISDLTAKTRLFRCKNSYFFLSFPSMLDEWKLFISSSIY